MFNDDRTALREYVIKRRKDGQSWKEIKKETASSDGTNYYYIYYLQRITPHEVGGCCDEWPIQIEPTE